MDLDPRVVNVESLVRRMEYEQAEKLIDTYLTGGELDNYSLQLLQIQQCRILWDNGYYKEAKQSLLKLKSEIDKDQIPLGYVQIIFLIFRTLNATGHIDKIVTIYNEFTNWLNDRPNLPTTVQLIVELTLGYYHTNVFEGEKGIDHFNHGLKIVNTQEDVNRDEVKYTVTDLLYFIALLYYEKKEYEKALKYHNKHLEFCKDINDSFLQSRASLLLGLFYRQRDETLQIEYYEKAENILKNLDHNMFYSVILHRIAGYYIWKKDQKKAEEYIIKSVDLREKVGHKSRLIQGYMIAGNLFRALENTDQSFHYYKKALELSKEVNHKLYIALLLRNIGSFHEENGNFEKSIQYLEKAINVAENLDNLRIEAQTKGQIGITYARQGELNLAIKYFKDVVELHRRTDNDTLMATYLANLGEIYRYQGNLDQAQVNLEDSINIRGDLPDPLANLGLVYLEKGEWDKAAEYIDRGIEIFRTRRDRFRIVQYLFYRQLVERARGDIEELKNCYTQICEIADESNHLRTLAYADFAHALVLMTKSRLLEKLQAITLLEKIIKDQVIKFEVIIIAILAYCELLILELKATSSSEALTDLKGNIERLYKIATDNQFYAYVVDAGILKAKLSLIEGDVQEGLELMQEAIDTSLKRGLSLKAKHAQQELETMNSEFSKWDGIVASNTEMADRINKTRIQKYISQAMKVMESE